MLLAGFHVSHSDILRKLSAQCAYEVENGANIYQKYTVKLFQFGTELILSKKVHLMARNSISSQKLAPDKLQFEK